MANCQNCGGLLASASTRSVANWIDRSKIPMERWGERLRGRIISVCPVCDAYALGSDHQSGCPFFLKIATAFATVHDHDWWNSREVDIRTWPMFGGVGLSPLSVSQAIEDAHRELSSVKGSRPDTEFDRGLAEVAGIHADKAPEVEWTNQLHELHARMGGRHSLDELTLAVKNLLEILRYEKLSTHYASLRYRNDLRRVKEAELENFYWHCRVASRIRQDFAHTRATNANFESAIRLATACITGKDGVPFASEDAIRERMHSHKKGWTGLDLIKEHVIPVSLIANQVRKAIDARLEPHHVKEMVDEARRRGYQPDARLSDHPEALVTACVIHKWTILAWVTKAENARFKDKVRHGGKSLVKDMPPDWEEDHGLFARYLDSGIKLVPILD
jgi:hypothetical protein